jgi:hypothetical protein
MTKKMTERTVAGAAYLLNFYTQSEVLKGNAANYINTIIKMKAKYSGMDDKTDVELSDQVTVNIAENAKMSVFNTYVGFMALKDKIKEFAHADKKGRLEELYFTIRDAVMPKVEDMEEYVMIVNKALVDAIDIFASAEGIYRAAYGVQPGAEA